MKLYFPYSKLSLDFVGYNHAIKLFTKELKEYLTDDVASADFALYINYPHHPNPNKLKVFKDANGKKHKLKLMLYTMYENSKLPSAWVKFLNKHCDVILVPNEWNKQIFKQNGVTKDIYIVSLGYDINKIQSYSDRKAIKKSKEYNFIWQGVTTEYGGRKGFDIVLNAWKELKKEGKIKDANLYIKTRPYKIAKLGLELKDHNNIIYINKLLSRKDMNDLYNKMDCGINTTHGEGFGFIPLEQMANGIPIMLANSCGISFVTFGNYLHLNYTLKETPTKKLFKHIAINFNELQFNFFGDTKLIKLFSLIKPINIPENKNNIIKITPKGLVVSKITFAKKMTNHIKRVLKAIQDKFKIYYVRNRKTYFLSLEECGVDAYVNNEDLKKKILFAYNNREVMKKIGRYGQEHVKRYFTSDIIKKDFDKFISDYYKQYNLKGE